MTNYILRRDPVWLECLSPGEAGTTIYLLGGDGEQVGVPVPLLPAASPLVQSVLTDLPPLAYSPCFISLPSTEGAVLLAARDILTTGIAASAHWEELEQVKQVLRMLGVVASLRSCQLAKLGEDFGIGEIVGNYSEGPEDVDLHDEADTIKLEELENTCCYEAVCSSKRMMNAIESKILLRDCSVMVKRGRASLSPTQAVKKSQMKDHPLYQDDIVPEVEDRAEDFGLREGNFNIKFQCSKCGMKISTYKDSLKYHILSHYHKEFFKVLPDSKPYPCPICKKCNRDRVGLVRHYAFKHKMLFEMTNLTPEDLQGIPVIDETATPGGESHQQFILDDLVSRSEYFQSHSYVLNLRKTKLSQSLEIDRNLPPGWRFKVYTRKSGRMDRKDIHYFTPDNMYIRSRFGVIEYMKLSGNYTIEEVERVANYLRL